MNKKYFIRKYKFKISFKIELFEIAWLNRARIEKEFDS